MIRIGHSQLKNQKLILPDCGEEAVSFDNEGFAEFDDQTGVKLLSILPKAQFHEYGKKEKKIKEPENLNQKKTNVWKTLPENLPDDVLDYIEKLKKYSLTALKDLINATGQSVPLTAQLNQQSLAQYFIDLAVKNATDKIKINENGAVKKRKYTKRKAITKNDAASQKELMQKSADSNV